MIGRIISGSESQALRALSTRVIPNSIKMKELSFQEFVKRNVESFDSFKKSEIIVKVCGNDIGRIKKIYEQFCAMEYHEYKEERYGGNSSLMI